LSQTVFSMGAHASRPNSGANVDGSPMMHDVAINLGEAWEQIRRSLRRWMDLWRIQQQENRRRQLAIEQTVAQLRISDQSWEELGRNQPAVRQPAYNYAIEGNSGAIASAPALIEEVGIVEEVPEEETAGSEDRTQPRTAAHSEFSRECGLCFDDHPTQRAAYVKCGHIVCLSCAQRFFEANPANIGCPFCRTEGEFVRLFEDSN
ncbi:hypothetical protein PFISCL1PPCAC_2761, partial [Pristionchus fissidentatus]